MLKKRWLILAILLGLVVISRSRPAPLRRTTENLRHFDLPSARLYDLLVASFVGGFYSLVADELTAAYAKGKVLEVGSGPGGLALRIAARAPQMELIVSDVSPDMVDLARRHIESAGLAQWVCTQVADVTVLPFPDAGFDCVVSTLSLHHWPDRASGLAEIYRVLKPGGEALIYDLAVSFWGHALNREELERLARESPFAETSIEPVNWPNRFPGIISRIRLRKNT